MKKTLLATLLATVSSVGTVFAADMYVKAPALEPVAVYNPWDIAFGAGLYSDYNFRGISQSNRKPSVNAYFEPRYNINNNLQLYAGVGGWSIAFANRPSAEIDLYAGIRPTFGKLSLDFGAWYYYYPGGTCYNANVDGAGNPLFPECFPNGSLLPSGNIIKKDVSFAEYYAKGSLAITDNFAIGGGGFYDVNWLNFGFDAVYASANAKITLPSAWLPANTGAYISGEYGHYWLGTTDAFYGNITLPDYSAWNIGAGLTWSVFTVDLRYYDSDLSQGECNAITSDFGAHFDPAAYVPNLNGSPGNAYGSKWCGESYVISLKADLTYGSNVK